MYSENHHTIRLSTPEARLYQTASPAGTEFQQQIRERALKALSDNERATSVYVFNRDVGMWDVLWRGATTKPRTLLAVDWAANHQNG